MRSAVSANDKKFSAPPGFSQLPNNNNNVQVNLASLIQPMSALNSGVNSNHNLNSSHINPNPNHNMTSNPNNMNSKSNIIANSNIHTNADINSNVNSSRNINSNLGMSSYNTINQNYDINPNINSSSNINKNKNTQQANSTANINSGINQNMNSNPNSNVNSSPNINSSSNPSMNSNINSNMNSTLKSTINSNINSNSNSNKATIKSHVKPEIFGQNIYRTPHYQESSNIDTPQQLPRQLRPNVTGVMNMHSNNPVMVVPMQQSTQPGVTQKNPSSHHQLNQNIQPQYLQPPAPRNIVEIVPVPPNLSSIVIDANFQPVLLKVKQSSGINFLSVNKRSDNTAESILIDGNNQTSINIAKHLIETHFKQHNKLLIASNKLLEIQTNLYLAQGELASGMIIEFNVKPELLGYVIGVKGARIKETKESTGISNVYIDDNTGLIKIIGPDSTSVQKAREFLEIEEEKFRITTEQLNYLTKSKEESVITDIRNTSKVIVAKIDRTNESVVFIGSKECLKIAGALLLTELDYIDQMVMMDEEMRNKRNELMAIKNQPYLTTDRQKNSRFSAQHIANWKAKTASASQQDKSNKTSEETNDDSVVNKKRVNNQITKNQQVTPKANVVDDSKIGINSNNSNQQSNKSKTVVKVSSDAFPSRRGTSTIVTSKDDSVISTQQTPNNLSTNLTNIINANLSTNTSTHPSNKLSNQTTNKQSNTHPNQSSSKQSNKSTNSSVEVSATASKDQSSNQSTNISNKKNYKQNSIELDKHRGRIVTDDNEIDDDKVDEKVDNKIDKKLDNKGNKRNDVRNDTKSIKQKDNRKDNKIQSKIDNQGEDQANNNIAITLNKHSAYKIEEVNIQEDKEIDVLDVGEISNDLTNGSNTSVNKNKNKNKYKKNKLSKEVNSPDSADTSTEKSTEKLESEKPTEVTEKLIDKSEKPNERPKYSNKSNKSKDKSGNQSVDRTNDTSGEPLEKPDSSKVTDATQEGSLVTSIDRSVDKQTDKDVNKVIDKYIDKDIDKPLDRRQRNRNRSNKTNNEHDENNDVIDITKSISTLQA